MTDRQKELAAYGFEYVDLEQMNLVEIPDTGREVRKTKWGTWEVQPWPGLPEADFWVEFEDVLDAIRCGSYPKLAKTW